MTRSPKAFDGNRFRHRAGISLQTRSWYRAFNAYGPVVPREERIQQVQAHAL